MKAAVFFPGIGYHVDKPLLYYSKKLAKNAGYETIDVPYGGFPKDVKSSSEKMKEAFASALAQTGDILKDVDWKQYEEVLFVSKSIGTAVAAAYADREGLNTRNIFFTPVEQTFSIQMQEGIVFTGTADPWVREGAVPALCKERHIPVHLIEQGNHSLETGNALKDIENLRRIMEIAQKYVVG